MSRFLQQELSARGVAEVVAVLRTPPDLPESARARAAGGVRATTVADGVRELSANFFNRVVDMVETSRTMALLAATRELESWRSGKAPRRRAATRPVPAVRYYPNLGVLYGTVDREGLHKLQRDTRVTDVTGAPPMRLIRPRRATPTRARSGPGWGAEALGIPRMWKAGLTGEGVLIGHLDTGADGRHPTLRAAIEHFAEFDDLGRRTDPDPRPYDSEDHGTHTAATLVGRGSGGRHVGLAPGARLASAVVIEGGDSFARVLAGMDWAIGLQVRVLNMSLGFPGYWEDFLPITRIVRRRGILPVFAVGNEGAGTSRSPGNYPEAVSVGACNRRGIVPRFSSSQRFARRRDPSVPDLVAPGVDIVSAMPGGGYQAMDGTSMATQHISGLAALLWQAHPRASVARIERAIFESCRRSPGMSMSRANRGMPDGSRALALLE